MDCRWFWSFISNWFMSFTLVFIYEYAIVYHNIMFGYSLQIHFKIECIGDYSQHKTHIISVCIVDIQVEDYIYNTYNTI